MMVKNESEKASLKYNIHKTNIMASSLITSWQIAGGKVETETDFIFLGYKIAVDGDCSHEIKRLLLLGRKAIVSLDGALKTETSFCWRKSMESVLWFSSSHVWMWKLDHKKAESWRIDSFELWHWRRLLRVPWTARRSNQSILKEINPEYSLEGLMLKLKLQYFSHLMQRANSLEKALMLRKIKGKRRRR